MPLSTLANWAKEFRKWLPDMNIIVYVGTRASREVRNKTSDGHIIAFNYRVKSAPLVSPLSNLILSLAINFECKSVDFFSSTKFQCGL